MSELVREALRHYERRSWWDAVNAYGRSKAAQTAVREDDVEELVQQAELPAAELALKPNRMRIVAGTNVIVSPLVFGGLPLR